MIQRLELSNFDEHLFDGFAGLCRRNGQHSYALPLAQLLQQDLTAISEAYRVPIAICREFRGFHLGSGTYLAPEAGGRLSPPLAGRVSAIRPHENSGPLSPLDVPMFVEQIPTRRE